MKKKILLVEDEESLGSFYEEDLKAEGYEVVTAGNGKEALRQLEESSPTSSSSILSCRSLDGMEPLADHGKKRTIPIIIHTSYPGYREDFMSWAADATWPSLGPAGAERHPSAIS